MKVRCLKSHNIDLVVGNVYELIGIEELSGMKLYRVIDESGEDYLYGSSCFEIIA